MLTDTHTRSGSPKKTNLEVGTVSPGRLLPVRRQTGICRVRSVVGAKTLCCGIVEKRTNRPWWGKYCDGKVGASQRVTLSLLTSLSTFVHEELLRLLLSAQNGCHNAAADVVCVSVLDVDHFSTGTPRTHEQRRQYDLYFS